MTNDQDFEIFLATAPGLESVLCEEVRAKAFKRPKTVPGGVVTRGGWPEVWRANLWIRGAGRVLARIAAFRVTHLAQLDSLAHRVPWASVLRPDIPFRVEAACSGSRIYHSGAAAERIATAIRDTLGAPESPDAGITVMARIDHDLCTISVDTSGEMLHKRGYKEAINAAPMRETMAALFLRQCGFDGREPVLDPMCGSGTFVIEAAEIAAGLKPGRMRHFAFEHLAHFDGAAWQAMRAAPAIPPAPGAVRFHGRDRDPGAIRMSAENALRAGLQDWTDFQPAAFADLERPEGPPGLVIINPPYGARIGNKGPLFGLHAAMGEVLRERFKGWRVGIVTSDGQLARATGLPLREPGPYIAHGGLKIRLYQTGPL